MSSLRNPRDTYSTSRQERMMVKRKRSADRTVAMEALRSALKSQYHATLAMLRTAIRRYHDDLWTARSDNAHPFWPIAYHTLFYTNLYLQPNNRVFRPWDNQQKRIKHMDKPLKTRL